MTTSLENKTLLTDPPVGCHFAQMHRDVSSLTDSVAEFVGAGLRAGVGVVVIATKHRAGVIQARLARTELPVESFRHAGQLVWIDAEECLNQFMRDGMPDWTDFIRALSPILEAVQAFGSGIPRAYGEMVDVLWRDGQQAAAIRLEEFWNELTRIYQFSLFCGYMLDVQEEESYSGLLHEIGRTHTDIIATKEDESFREALEMASRDIFGVSLPQLVGFSSYEEFPGESRLPIAQRTVLWILKNMPASSATVLERARFYYRRNTESLRTV